MRFSLKVILNKNVPRQEPRQPSGRGRAIVNRIWHAGLTKTTLQTFGISKFCPDPASSASHVEKSLVALQQSADALPESDLKTHVKSAVSSVSWLTEKHMEQSEEAQARSQRSLKVLETLAEAVGYDPSKVPSLMLEDICSFKDLLLEIRTAMEPPMEQSRLSPPFRSNRHGKDFKDFDKRLSDLLQKFEEACSHRSGFDIPFVSAGASRVSPGPYSHALESKPFRRRIRFGLKSRLDRVSSTCADVASTTLKVLEKPGSSVPILNGVVTGVSALLDTAKRVKQPKERARTLLQHAATLAEDVDHDQSSTSMLERVRTYKDQLLEVRTAMVPITEQGWISRLFRLNRNEDILDTSNYCLNEAQQRFMLGNINQIGGITIPEGYRRQPQYFKPSPSAFKRLILIPGYSSGTLSKAVAVLHV